MIQRKHLAGFKYRRIALSVKGWFNPVLIVWIHSLWTSVYVHVNLTTNLTTALTLWSNVFHARCPENQPEITHNHLLFSVAQGIFWLSTERLSRNTFHLKEGGERGSCNCDILHRRLGADSVTKSPKAGPLLIFSISLESTERCISRGWISYGDGIVLFGVDISLLCLLLLGRRLVDDDMSDAGDGTSTAEDSHVTVLPDVHEPEKYKINAEAMQTKGRHYNDVGGYPLPLHVATAGKNYLNEETIPSPPHWGRRAILPNHIKFRTCELPL